MPLSSISPFVRRSFISLTVVGVLCLGGCAGFFENDDPQVNVVGLEPLVGQGLEMRMNVKLRVQNPNETPIDYDGVALELEVNGKPFASGVSNQQGSIPRFGESVLSVPVSISAFSAIRQAWGLASVDELNDLPYVVRGKLARGTFGARRFTDKGTLTLPGMGAAPQ